MCERQQSKIGFVPTVLPRVQYKVKWNTNNWLQQKAEVDRVIMQGPVNVCDKKSRSFQNISVAVQHNLTDQ